MEHLEPRGVEIKNAVFELDLKNAQLTLKIGYAVRGLERIGAEVTKLIPLLGADITCQRLHDLNQYVYTLIADLKK
jgi:hypothetical protein